MKVKCPSCQKKTTLDKENPYRPFCSERCQTLDLGAWADERYRVPVSDQEFSGVNENPNEPVQSQNSLAKHQLN